MTYSELKDLLHSSEIHDFLRGVHIEAVRQVDALTTIRKGHMEAVDWFAMANQFTAHAQLEYRAGNLDKALQHCISSAAAAYNWHCAIRGADIHLAPGRSDIRKRG